MSAIHHTADGLVLPVRIDKARLLTRKLKSLRRRVLPWWDGLRARNRRR